MNYNVGQILYMTNSKSLKIIPIQIVEEVTRITLNGSEKTYMVQFPDSKKTIADINTLNGELFDDIVALKHKMIENATSSIEKMIMLSEKLALSEYQILDKSKKNKNIKDNIGAGVQVENNDNIIMVDLGGGIKAKMKTEELEKVTSK